MNFCLTFAPRRDTISTYGSMSNTTVLVLQNTAVFMTYAATGTVVTEGGTPERGWTLWRPAGFASRFRREFLAAAVWPILYAVCGRGIHNTRGESGLARI